MQQRLVIDMSSATVDVTAHVIYRRLVQRGTDHYSRCFMELFAGDNPELGELTSEKFDELINRVADPVIWDCGRGRRRELILR